MWWCRYKTSGAPFWSGWWIGRRWAGPGRRWQAQRWTGCELRSGKPSPPGRQGRTSTTGPAGSMESSRWWKTEQSQYSFSEFSSGLSGCYSLNTAGAFHWKVLEPEQRTETKYSAHLKGYEHKPLLFFKLLFLINYWLEVSRCSLWEYCDTEGIVKGLCQLYSWMI